MAHLTWPHDITGSERVVRCMFCDCFLEEGGKVKVCKKGKSCIGIVLSHDILTSIKKRQINKKTEWNLVIHEALIRQRFMERIFNTTDETK